MDYNEAELAEFFAYLDDLRESGETNMFGASSYLQDEFGMGRRDAGSVLSKWMGSFTHDKTPEERAAATVAG